MIKKNTSKIVEKAQVNQTLICDLVYDEDESKEHRVYILENDRYVPFLVLSADYNGNCLLMREYLLDELVPYNDSGDYGSYYNGSRIDKYLNEDYYQQMSERTKQLILMSEVEITTKEAIDTHRNVTEIINRHIFLLSANEIKASLGTLTVKEGKELTYFKTIKNKIARHENLEADSWMLRTPELSGYNSVIGITDDGSVGMGGISTIAGVSENAVRPVFCIPNNTKISKSEKIIEGETVFVIE